MSNEARVQHPGTDWIAEIKRVTRSIFVEQNPHWFLLGRGALQAPPPLTSTLSTRAVDPLAALKRHETLKFRPEAGAAISPATLVRFVRALQKRTDLFANMITLG